MPDEMTFEAIMQRCLARVPANVDKREGSIIYDALAPAAAEIAQAFLIIQTIKDDLAFPDTVRGENLTKKAIERGIYRKAATRATRRALCYDIYGALMDVPTGTRFSGGSVNFVLVDRYGTGTYKAECETPGVVGNQYFGALIPIDYVAGLGRAELQDVIVPGEDEESDDALRARYFSSMDGVAFGGNIKDYHNWVNAIDGVGGVRVYPVWNGGGSVKLVIINSAWEAPSVELVQIVQTAVDPEIKQGTGNGIAPIGHTVTVEGVETVVVNITMELHYQTDYTWARVKQSVENAIKDYFLELGALWEGSEYLVVRISQVETRVLGLEGILDVSGTTLNGAAQNLVLEDNQIPVLGTVTPQ